MDTDYWKNSPFGEEGIFHPSFDNKDLKIRYVFCQKDDKYTYLYFDIAARNLSSEKATLIVVESEVIHDETIVSQTIDISRDGTKRFRVRFNETILSKSFLEGEFEFNATVSCDGLSATTDEFRISCGIRSNVSTSNKLEQKKSDQEDSLQNSICGVQYKGLVKCYSRNGKYGPVYYGDLPMNSFQNYNTLILNKVLTEDEKLVILAITSDTTIPINPTEWGEKHSDYESALVAIYGPLRGEKLPNVKHPMTDAVRRYNNLKTKL